MIFPGLSPVGGYWKAGGQPVPDAVTVDINAQIDGASLSLLPFSDIHVEIDAQIEGAEASFVVDVDIGSALESVTHLIRYTCTVTDGGQSVTVPISSWQATLQEGAASYAQVVVPAFGAVADQVLALDRPDFIVYREARAASGGLITRTQMARAPMSITINRGPENYTATMSGYALLAFPEIAGDINVTGVRSETSGSDRRIRCDIAWGVQPGRTISANGSTLRVDYVNYYVIARPGGIESYMDVGERNG